MSYSIFPSSYYTECRANLRPRKNQWFCNRPLSPLRENTEVSAGAIQSPSITSSNYDTDMMSNTKDSLDYSSIQPDFVSNDQDILQSNDSHVDPDPFTDEICLSPSDDCHADPDFEPTTFQSDLSSEENDNSENEDELISKTTEMIDNISVNQNQNYLGEYKENMEKRKGNKKKDFCFFCESYILNFARHIQRNHSLESEVQKILSLPPKNRERKKLLDNLRKQGNFLNSSTIKKPLRKPTTSQNILPCSHCKGFFSGKQLWRHRKKCIGQSDKKHQAEGQNLLLKNLRVDEELRNKVFPRMRPDSISMVAKSDELICAYGARYLKSHREKHFINVTSRKMREMARLLIEIKKQKPSVTSLFDALKPENFGLFISATKAVSKYNQEQEIFESASTALNMGTSLKQCCQVAIIMILKRKSVHSTISSAEAEANIKSFIQLVESEWRYEISTQASNNLNLKTWNKITMVPLATDLKIMKEYLVSKANEAVKDLLSNNSNIKAYITLLETIFCRVLLLNRRRPGELQRLPLYLYKESDNNNQSYEEFSSITSSSEKILLQKFKRLVIRGKRARGVPVLFSPDIQNHIETLLTYRDNFVNKKNLYLFGNPNTIEPICGYKVISKHAVLAGTKNPKSITATKLRKHLATLTQIFSMTEGDIEQLCTFMGHTVGVHRGSYRLPDDVYQTAKVAKLLLLMEGGNAGEFKGKSLDDININLDIDEKEDECNEEIEPIPGTSRDFDETEINLPTPASPSTNKNSKAKSFKKAKVIKIPWTEQQKMVVRKYFVNHIKKGKPPKKDECLELKEKNPTLLENKNWVKIKVFVQNEYMKKNKNK